MCGNPMEYLMIDLSNFDNFKRFVSFNMQSGKNQKIFGYLQRLGGLYPLGTKGIRYKKVQSHCNVGRTWVEVLKTSGIQVLTFLDVLQLV